MAVYDVSLTGVDAFGRRFGKRGQVEAVSEAAALAATSTWADALQSLIDGEVQKYAVSQTVEYVGTLGAGANRDVGATLTLGIGSKRATLKVPTVKLAVINVDGTVDITDALVTAFTDNYVGGPFYISDGESADSLIKGTLDA